MNSWSQVRILSGKTGESSPSCLSPSPRVVGLYLPKAQGLMSRRWPLQPYSASAYVPTWLYHLAWHTEPCNPTVFVAILLGPFHFPDMDYQPPFPVRTNGTRLPNGGQNSMWYGQLCTVTNISWLYIPPIYHSLSYLILRGWTYIYILFVTQHL